MIEALTSLIGELPQEYYIVGWIISAAFAYTFALQLLDFMKAVINK